MPDSSLPFILCLYISVLYACLPPLKNDGRSELLCHDILMLNEYIKKSIGNVSCPRLSGKVAALAVERGKYEQKRKNKKISMSKTNKKYSDLCTQTCPYRLARLGTSLRVRGKLTLRKKKYSFYQCLHYYYDYSIDGSTGGPLRFFDNNKIDLGK